MQLYHMFYFPATQVAVREDGRKYPLPQELTNFLHRTWEKRLAQYKDVPAVAFAMACTPKKKAVAVYSPSDPYCRKTAERIAKQRFAGITKSVDRLNKALEKALQIEDEGERNKAQIQAHDAHMHEFISIS